ncbi:MAG TPA: hypothetical protein VHI71_08935 [Actinomycetota bacterium]|nr:hypothetical protein [Actinomycetota bacterium]
MAALAYLVLPVTGMLAYFSGRSSRVRFHGLQAIVLGALWPALLYVAAALNESVVVPVALGGAALWVLFLGATAFGKDPALPWIGPKLKELATDEP